MRPDEIASRRDEIVARSGPWLTDNLRLARNVYTIDEGAPGRDARVRRAVQLVADLSGSRLKGLRVLDLGCGEGGFAIELGKQGAEVVAIEGRAALAEKAEFAGRALGLRRVSILRGDVRRLSAEEHGFFDVVLALGVLDRLDAPAVFDVVRRIGAVCKGFAVLEARLAARSRETREFEGTVYRGAPSREPKGAKIFLLTRASTLSLLERAGFTSVAEALDPEAGEDAPCFAALKGRRVALHTAPRINAVPAPSWLKKPPAPPRAGLKGLLSRKRR